MISLTELEHYVEIETRSFGMWSGKNACFDYRTLVDCVYDEPRHAI